MIRKIKSFFRRRRRTYRSGDMFFRIVKDRSSDKYCVEYRSKYERTIWIRLASRADRNIFTVYRDMLGWMEFYKDRKLERV